MPRLISFEAEVTILGVPCPATVKDGTLTIAIPFPLGTDLMALLVALEGVPGFYPKPIPETPAVSTFTPAAPARVEIPPARTPADGVGDGVGAFVPPAVLKPSLSELTSRAIDQEIIADTPPVIVGIDPATNPATVVVGEPKAKRAYNRKAPVNPPAVDSEGHDAAPVETPQPVAPPFSAPPAPAVPVATWGAVTAPSAKIPDTSFVPPPGTRDPILDDPPIPFGNDLDADAAAAKPPPPQEPLRAAPSHADPDPWKLAAPPVVKPDAAPPADLDAIVAKYAIDLEVLKIKTRPNDVFAYLIRREVPRPEFAGVCKALQTVVPAIRKVEKMEDRVTGWLASYDDQDLRGGNRRLG